MIASPRQAQDAQATIRCRRIDHHRFGTHSIFIGVVEEVSMRDEIDPLDLSERQLRRLRRLAREQVRRVAIALISSALPEGSRKNIVACSPGCPRKRTVGG
jgi:flavin reductase (DIM6/NTAB) family NADH-FMN oxidoreductase RutF